MKVLLVFASFFLLGVLGGGASPLFYRSLVESRLAAESRSVLEHAGLPHVRIEHDYLLASVSGVVSDEGERSRLAASLESEIPGAYFDLSGLETSENRSAELIARLGGDGVVTLDGALPDKDSRILFGVAASSIRGVSRVENRIELRPRLPRPEWRNSAPHFLYDFFSTPGVTRLVIRRSEMLLEGEVVSAEVRESLGEKARSLLGDSMVVKNHLAVKSAPVAEFRLIRFSDRIELTGLLPDGDFRLRLRDTVAGVEPGLEIDDRIIVAETVSPPWWIDHALGLIPLFLRDTGGASSLEYAQGRVILGGLVATSAAAENLVETATVGKPQAVLVENALRLEPSSDSTLVMTTEEEGRIILSGTVSRMSIKDGILGILMLEFPDLVIYDLLRVSERARDPSWQNPGELFAAMIRESLGPEVELGHDRVVLSGETETPETRDRLVELAARVIANPSAVEDRIAVVPPPTEPVAEEKLRLDLGGLTIYFDSGQTELSIEGRKKLREAADLIREFGGEETISLHAFHDPSGRASLNETLSMRRAGSVRDQLIGEGVPADRIRVQYGGEDRTNVSADTLWKSRRVELRVDEAQN